MSLNEYVRLIYNSLTGVKPRAVDGTASVIALGFLSLSQNQSRAGVIDLIEYA